MILYLLPMMKHVMLPLLTMAGAMGFQAARITGSPTEYVAMGKVVVEAADPGQNGEAFFQKEIEVLQGAELRNRALQRVHALHPEFKDVDLKTQASVARGSSILNVVVRGGEPNYLKAYLNALLDEYRELRSSADQSLPAGGPDHTSVLERPNVAVEMEPNLAGPMIVAGVLGAAVGLTLDQLLIVLF